MSYIPRLIKLYADNPAVNVKSTPGPLEKPFGKSLEELCLLPGFSAQQEFVQSLAQAIENDAACYDTPDTVQQISECLKALMRVAIYDDSVPSTVILKLRTMRRLFVRMYARPSAARPSTPWTKAQLKHFWFVAGRLAVWQTYFLSYTNSGAAIVNDEYRTIIRKYADPKVRKARNPDEDNILVDAMVNWLERNKLSHRSFYDKKAIEGGDYLEESIAPAVKNTLAFVQLVQLDTFSTKQSVNWSYQEYELFNKYTEEQLQDRERYRVVFETRFIPVLAGEPEKLKLDDYKLPPQFRPWKKRIFDKAHYVCLPKNKQVFDDAMKTLEAAIVHRAYRIIENVPA